MSSDPPRLVLWQNAVSIHQAPLVRALAEGGPVVVVTESAVRPGRERLGWHQPDYGSAELVVAPAASQRARLHRELAGGAVHIFSGLGAYPATTASMAAIVAHGSETVGVFQEPWNSDGWRGHLRGRRYRRRAGQVRDRIQFVLTTGPLGVRQYENLRLPNVASFAYFVDGSTPVPRRPAPAEVRVAFVGAMTPRKRAGLLLHALARHRGGRWCLNMIGDGPERPALTVTAQRLGLAPAVRWTGALANAEVRRCLAEQDVLVLPSRFDGWGAVVNEALQAGARVIVSDRCGAQDLVRGEDQGWVFDHESSLVAALGRAIAAGPSTEDERRRRAVWADRHIGAPAGARYLREIVDRVRRAEVLPTPPWHGTAALNP